MLAGHDLNDEIRLRIQEARAVVVLLSEHSIESPWVKGEIELAGKKVVGVRLQAFDVRENAPVRLLGGHIIDLIDWDGDDGHPSVAKIAARCAELAQASLVEVTPCGPRAAAGDAAASRDVADKVTQTIENSGKVGVIGVTLTGSIEQNF
jgi:hypothetical protein